MKITIYFRAYLFNNASYRRVDDGGVMPMMFWACSYMLRQEQPCVTAAIVMAWMEQTRPKLNREQFRFLELVVDRLLVEMELRDPEASIRDATGDEPLRYLLHGPPGTGKSHVLKFVEELFDMVGMQKGLDWQVVAFQATNASDLGGDTIHHAMGLSINVKSHDEPMGADRAKRVAYWRWIFIDEISLVPANLLAKMEMRVREAKPSADKWKKGAEGKVRPFAGINVIAVGDFKQLPPPQGGYLADIPHQHLVGPNSAAKASDIMANAGKLLMWEDFEGIVELTERERCKDAWWNEVTDELRAGNLSLKNHKYLHGKPVEGCQLSCQERASRRRVITGADDPRLNQPRFHEAAAIVANNDAKYQINKDRAKKFARDANAELRWAIAKDVATAEVLQSQLCSKDRKIKHLGVAFKFKSIYRATRRLLFFNTLLTNQDIVFRGADKIY